MEIVDHANRILSDGNKYYLVIFSNFYKKEVSTYVEVPKPLSGYFYVSQQCTLDGKFNNKVTALVKADMNLEKWTDIKNAWIVDISNKSITVIDSSRVYCFNDAWGI